MILHFREANYAQKAAIVPTWLTNTQNDSVAEIANEDKFRAEGSSDMLQ